MFLTISTNSPNELQLHFVESAQSASELGPAGALHMDSIFLGNLRDILITLGFVRFEQIKESVKRSVQVPLVRERASIVLEAPF